MDRTGLGGHAIVTQRATYKGIKQAGHKGQSTCGKGTSWWQCGI